MPYSRRARIQKLVYCALLSASLCSFSSVIVAEKSTAVSVTMPERQTLRQTAKAAEPNCPHAGR
jgi:tRNA G10  N-methylase Trm11